MAEGMPLPGLVDWVWSLPRSPALTWAPTLAAPAGRRESAEMLKRCLPAILTIFCCLACVLAPASARAHEVQPAQLAMHEQSPGRFAVIWHRPATLSLGNLEIRPKFPNHCKYANDRVDCGEEGLTGKLRFVGQEGGLYRIVVQINTLDGAQRTHVLMSTNTELDLGSRPGGKVLGGVFGGYLEIGVQHILGGLDHLLFVVSLLFLVGYGRMLFWTITSFTLAHSITLAASTFEWIRVSQAPVDATIALSILLVTVEINKTDLTLTRRYPWAVAFCFGLLHGIGFASALSNIGLPPGQLLRALLAFNVGVEVGQLGIIAAVGALVALLTKLFSARKWARVGVTYVMGTLAAYWMIGRLLKLLSLA